MKTTRENYVTRKLAALLAFAMLTVNLLTVNAFAEEVEEVVGFDAPVISDEEIVAEQSSQIISEEEITPEQSEDTNTVSVTNGMAVLNIDGWSIQLTPSLVTAKGVFDGDTRTAYLILKDSAKSLKAYNYDLQSEMDFSLISIDSGVTDFTDTGYVLSDGTEKAFPTLSELKVMLGLESGDGKTDDKPSTPSGNTPDTPEKPEDKPEDKPSTDTPSTPSGNTPDTPEKPEDKPEDKPEQPSKSEETSVSGNAVKNEAVILDGNVIVTLIEENNQKRQFTIPTSEVGYVQSVGLDADNMAFVVYSSGRADVWHSSFGYLYTVAESGATGLVFDANGLVTGIKVGDEVKTFTLSQIAEKIERAGGYAVIQQGWDVYLLDGNDNVIAMYTILSKKSKTSRIKFNGKKYTVKLVGFNKKGELVFLKGKTLYKVTPIEEKKNTKEKIAKKVKTLAYNKYGVLDYAELKDGSYIDCLTGASVTVKK